MEIDTTDAVRTVIAQQILTAIGTEQRDAILSKSIKAALTEWGFKNVLENAVAADGARVAAEMLATPEWQERVHEAVRQGLDSLIVRLPWAIEQTLATALIGTPDGNYGDRKNPVLMRFLGVKEKS